MAGVNLLGSKKVKDILGEFFVNTQSINFMYFGKFLGKINKDISQIESMELFQLID